MVVKTVQQSLFVRLSKAFNDVGLVKIQLPISFTRASITGPLYHGTPEARGHTSYADRECLMYACMYRVCFACVCMGVCVD